MVNYVLSDESKKFLDLPSYVLKTILFRQVESKENSYWEQEFVLEIFFRDLLEKLIECIEAENCPMYWNASINLLADMSKEDFVFIKQRLDIISDNIVSAIADDWLELERCIRLNCCGCCVVPHYKLNIPEPDIERYPLIKFPCRYGDQNCCGQMEYDDNVIHVY